MSKTKTKEANSSGTESVKIQWLVEDREEEENDPFGEDARGAGSAYVNTVGQWLRDIKAYGRINVVEELWMFMTMNTMQFVNSIAGAAGATSATDVYDRVVNMLISSYEAGNEIADQRGFERPDMAKIAQEADIIETGWGEKPDSYLHEYLQTGNWGKGKRGNAEWAEAAEHYIRSTQALYILPFDVRFRVEQYAAQYGDLPSEEMIRDMLAEQDREHILHERLQDISRRGMSHREDFITNNVRLPFKIAKKYMGRGVEFEDLISAANVGLIIAVDKFNGMLGYRFSTYATNWIRQAIQRHIDDNSRTIRLSVHLGQYLIQINRIKSAYLSEHGVEPTSRDIAARWDQTDLTPAQRMVVESAIRSDGSLGHIMDGQIQAAIDTAVRQIDDIIIRDAELTSLDTPIGNDESDETGTFADLVEDQQAKKVDHAIINDERARAVRTAVLALTDREIEILDKRFDIGLLGPRRERIMTLEEVGEDMNLTRERIRQIEKKALERLRHPRFNALRAFVFK